VGAGKKCIASVSSHALVAASHCLSAPVLLLAFMSVPIPFQNVRHQDSASLVEVHGMVQQLCADAVEHLSTDQTKLGQRLQQALTSGSTCFWLLQTYSATSWQPITTWLNADPLAAAASVDMKKATPAFYYLSHTFTHQVRGASWWDDCRLALGQSGLQLTCTWATTC
jgi:hypothetical protein